MSDKKKKGDLTRIQDLSEFVHGDDPDVDALFDSDPDLEENPTAINNEEDDLFIDLDSSEEVVSDEGTSPQEDFEEFQGEFQEKFQDAPNEESIPFIDFENEDERSSEESFLEEREEATFSDLEPEEKTSEDLEQEDEVLIKEKNDSKDSPAEDFSSTREDFKDVRAFAEQISYGDIHSGGNPPFSLAIRNIFDEGEEIYSILQQHGLVTPTTEATLKEGLKKGAILISQISEYSAIYLSHKLRRFNIDIQMGMSHEIHPTDSYPQDKKGQSTGEGLKRNKAFTQTLKEDILGPQEIMTSTENRPKEYEIYRYLDVVMEEISVGPNELDLDSEESQFAPLYQQVISKIKHKAHKLGANAVIGINFQIISPNDGQLAPQSMRIVGTGNAVILTKASH